MRNITITVIIGTVVILSVYDIFAAVYGSHSTISEIITTAAYNAPVVPFVVGFLCGHWFFRPQYRD